MDVPWPWNKALKPSKPSCGHKGHEQTKTAEILQMASCRAGNDFALAANCDRSCRQDHSPLGRSAEP